MPLFPLFSRIKSPAKRQSQAARTLTRHEREARRLALRNAAAAAESIAWLGPDYCLAKKNAD